MRIVDVQIAGRAYPIFIGAGARDQLAPFLARLSGVQKTTLIADEVPAGLHGDKVLSLLPQGAARLTFPSGEESKSLATAGRLFDGLAAFRLGRRDAIVTLGGGVACDLGGFVAATWLRGVRYIQMPTTLEAAIDASVGGKTAVNHASGKNLIGAFHQPSAVIIDTDFLVTLPEREFLAGLSESVKQAAVRDPAFFAWHEANVSAILAREPAALIELISMNCTIKAEVVAKDEREDSLRAILNYGHTLGHAFEHLLGYELRHGECVSLGVLAENELAVLRGVLPRGVADRVRTLIERLNLLTHLPRGLSPADVIAACKMDKKNRDGTIHATIINAIGTPQIAAQILEGEIEAALRAVAADKPA